MNAWASDHAHNLAGATPLVALDMYELSYHMDFGAKAAAYVDASCKTFLGRLPKRCLHRRVEGALKRCFPYSELSAL